MSELGKRGGTWADFGSIALFVEHLTVLLLFLGVFVLFLFDFDLSVLSCVTVVFAAEFVAQVLHVRGGRIGLGVLKELEERWRGGGTGHCLLELLELFFSWLIV